MKRTILYSAIAGISLLASSQLYATDTAAPTDTVKYHHHHRWAHERADNDMPNLHKFQAAVSKLNLSADQKQKIRGIIAGAVPQLKQYVAQMRSNRAELVRTMHERYSDSRVRSLSNSQGQLYGKILTLKLKTIHQVYAVLTPEQQAQLHAMKAKWRAKHLHHHHNKQATNQ